VTVWFLSKRVFSEGQAEDAILLGFRGLGQWRGREEPPQTGQMGKMGKESKTSNEDYAEP